MLCGWEGHVFPVLILGETGTGKEVVARAIHNVEAKGPFVVVDCSSLVGPLMESELFGYAKGAFTGAHNQKLGLLDAANGGNGFSSMKSVSSPWTCNRSFCAYCKKKSFVP